MAKIIISYRRSDSVAIAGRICDRLVARYGNDSVFMDVDDIPSAGDLREYVRKSLHQGDILLAVVGPNWLAGDGDRLREIEKDTDLVRLEVEMALEEGIQIIPVLIDGSSLPRANELPDGLKQFALFNPTALNSGRDFHLHMERLIRSIDQILKNKSDAAVSKVAHISAEPRAPVRLAPTDVRSEGERRQVTIVFCDLVGSTALATRLDPEDMREVIGAFQRACGRIIPAYNGFLAKYMGDGILAYFGYPRAHEDDAQQAVRAGLDLVGAIARLETHAGIALQARVGITTGVVVVGDLIGEGMAQTRDIVGEAPNMAARLQALAEPGTVLIAASTRRLIGRIFECRDLGPVEMRGFTAPVQVWQVLNESTVESRFEALRSPGSPLVGREEEIDLAMRRWRQAQKGDGSVLLISGEAGIGKSRIVASLSDRIETEPHTLLRYQCSAYHGNSALHPIIGQLKHAARAMPEDSAGELLDKLEAMLAVSTADVMRVAPLFATLLSIPFEGRYPPLDLIPAQQRRQIFAALIEQLEGLAGRNPVLVLFEDVHWADATSIELLDLVIDRVGKLPVLMIITFRQEFQPRWTGLQNISTITLGRLDQRHVQAIIDQVIGGQALPTEVVDQIIMKTDGIPLFVEELTKAVLESELVVKKDGGLRIEGPLPLLAIPATLKDSLMARLDRLVPVRQVAQAGAAIGRNFSYAMLAAVTGQSDESLCAALQSLIDAELIFHRGTPPDATYIFKHALVQDVAYESLLRGRRQILHARIVQAIESHIPEMIETEPELLAHHCIRAELTEKAIDYWSKAGHRSLQRSNLVEAVNHFKAAINALVAQPDSTERRRQELTCQTAMAQALIGAKGYGATETMAAWQRAHELATAVGDARQRFAATYGLWVGQYAQGQLSAIDRLAEQCLRAAETEGDRTQLCVAHRMTGIAHFIVGDFSGGRDHCIGAVELYDRTVHPLLANQLGHDLLVAGLCFKALSLWPLGYPDLARQAMDAALTHAKQLDHGPSLAYTYWHAGIIGMLMLGEESLVAEHADTLVTLSEKQGLTLWVAWGRVAQGWVRARTGGGATAVELIRSGLDAARKTGNRIYETTVLGLLGDAQAANGDVEAGLASVAEGIEFAESSRQLYWLAELHRLRGAIRLKSQADKAGAELALRQAVAVARQQQAPSWELRATIDLATLLVADGKTAEAHTLLATAYGWFHEGFESKDLRAAKALLVNFPVRSV
jgi:class 3 adenylate cyclase/predicted ATPase